MVKRPFMEMDLEEFEDKKEEVIDEPSLDFDFDEDVEETTSDTDPELSEIPSDDNSLEIPEFHKEFIESGKAKKYEGIALGDEAGMTRIGRFFNIDEIPAEYKKVNDTYKDLTSPKDDHNVKVIPVATADSGVELNDGEMDDYVVLYKHNGTFYYAILQTSTDPDYLGLFAFANDVNDLEKYYDFWSKHQIVSKDSSVDQSSTNDSSETPEIPETPDFENSDDTETTQESFGFSKLSVSRFYQEEVGETEDEDVGDDTETFDDNFNEPTDENEPSDYEGQYLDNIKSYNDDDPMKELELAVGAKLPKDFAEGVSIFDTNDFSNAKIDHDGETIFQVEEMFPLERIINTRKNGNFELGDDKLFAIGSDGFGNAIVMNTEDWCYYVWNHETKDTTLIAKTFSDEGIDPGYDITENDTLIGLLENGSNNDNTTDEPDEEDTETQESFRFPKPPISRFYQEADEENTDDDDKESSDENNDEELELSELPEMPEMPNLDDDEDTTDSEDENTDDVDINNFGMDTSDVQNDYNPKDVESLNKLIAAESEAINDYFDASKDTRNEDLRTLFSDIGHEERFHLEQLMYSKSKLTGEKYEPRDPEVKAEYEELINGGMDEETAAYTAMDKRSMLGEDNGNDSDMEELEQESAFITDSLQRNEMITSYLSSNIINNPYDISKELGIIVEAFYQEAIDNVSSAPKKYTKLDSPLTILTKGLKVAVNGLVRMSSVVRDSMRKNKLSRARKMEWIKKHGIAELFKGGISLYLYDDNKNKFDLDTPCRYVDFLYRLTKAIGESCGVKLTAAAQHKTISNPIKFSNIKEGMYKLSQVIFNKTKVVVTDDNKAALQNEFFGYSDEKINVKVTHGTDQAINDSGNIYNRLDACILVTKKYADISIAVLDEMKKLEGDVNSIYYKNRTAYNDAMKNIKTVVDKYTQFISAMSHDLTEIMKIDNGLLKLTRERDMTEQSGSKWEGPDIRVNTQKQSGTQYTKRKK